MSWIYSFTGSVLWLGGRKRMRIGRRRWWSGGAWGINPVCKSLDDAECPGPHGASCANRAALPFLDEAGPALPRNLKRPSLRQLCCKGDSPHGLPFLSLISKPATPVRSQHAPGGQIQSVTLEESADKKELLTIYLIKNQGISMEIHTNGPGAGKKEPGISRHSFSQLRGMLATENTSESVTRRWPLLKGLLGAALIQELVSQGHKDFVPSLKSGQSWRSILALVHAGLAEASVAGAW